MSTPRKIRCRVEQVSAHGDRVYTVELQPEQPLPLFQPGQFLHLTLEAYDPADFWPESRVFSIASSPDQRRCLRISYAVKGVYTARMEQALRPGLPVWVKLPYGSFVVQQTSDAVLIAGGTGITAFQAFIEKLTPAYPHQVVLLLGARRQELLLGLNAAERKRSQVAWLRAFYFSEDLTTETAGIRPGRVQLSVLGDCNLSGSSLYYLAGPPAMLTACTAGLVGRGVPAERIRVDAWE
ncbi:MAG: FAD-dependent oxidoreductase [Kiritimatiellaeota bacterium]|nr:FAD-dependent oxidoreductase [Kiritimatiellota bacterium]